MSYRTPLEIFQSFKTSQPEYMKCDIEGSLPADLPEGSLIFNGPGVFQFGDDVYRTVLDGMAVLQQYSFKSGSVLYRNRIIESDSYKRNLEAGCIVAHELGTLGRADPTKSFLQRYWEYLTDTITNPTDNTVVNILKIGERLFALTETPFINEINPTDLTVKTRINLRDSVPVHILTAHPLKDRDGNIWNIGTSFLPASKYCILKTPADGCYERTKIVDHVRCRWRLSPSYYHSFGMSENFLVLIEQTVCMPLLSMALATIRQKPFSDLMKIYPKEQCIIHLYNKKERRFLPVKFCTESFITLHHINTYEDEDQLIVDVCAHKEISFLEDFQLDSFAARDGKRLPPVEIWRFSLPLVTEKDSPEIVDEAICCDGTSDVVHCLSEKFASGDMELPIINPKFEGRAYRYVYGVRQEKYDKVELVKFDFNFGDVITWSEEHCITGTPVFVESTSGYNLEDSGYILAPVLNQTVGKSHFLIILDARSMTEVCRVLLPSGVHVPYTFHGTFETSL